MSRHVTTRSQLDACDIDRSWIAFDLLEGIDGREARDERILSRIAFTMPVGDYSRRITFEHRYEQVDERIVDLLSQHPHAKRELSCHDVGVSNGLTSLRLYQALSSHASVMFQATDKCVCLNVVTISSCLRVIFDQQGQWVQMIIGGVVFLLRQPQGEIRRLNRAVSVMLGWWLPSAMKLLAGWGWARFRTIPLFHPKVVQQAEGDSGFEIGEGDLFKMGKERHELVRAMSVIFNWPVDLKREAVHALAEATIDNGLLVLGQGGGPYPLRCSIYRREGNRMRHLEDVGNPAREHEEVLNAVLGVEIQDDVVTPSRQSVD